MEEPHLDWNVCDDKPAKPKSPAWVVAIAVAIITPTLAIVVGGLVWLAVTIWRAIP